MLTVGHGGKREEAKLIPGLKSLLRCTLLIF